MKRLSRGRTEKLLNDLVVELPALRRKLRQAPDTCIDQSFVAIAALREAGVRAQPFPTRVMAYSPDGTHCVRIGFGVGDPEERYDGHLCVLAAGRYLLDVTADQITWRAEREDFDVRAFVAEVPREFVRAERSVEVMTPGGCRVQYQPHPEDKGWAYAPEGGVAWQQHPRVGRDVLEYIGWRG